MLHRTEISTATATLQRQRHRTLTALVLGAFLALTTGSAAPAHDTDRAQISGLYVEARTSDIYTGPCFANGEVNLAGREAMLAWQVESGGTAGIDLSGLGVVAVVRANATLGDPHGPTLQTQAVVVVDDSATHAQRTALVEMARVLAEPLLDNVVSVRSAPVEIRIAGAGAAQVSAGQAARLETRALNETDHLCGNEEVYYPPLAPTTSAQPGVTLEHRWSGEGLGMTWRSPNKRSAFIGTFER